VFEDLGRRGILPDGEDAVEVVFIAEEGWRTFGLVTMLKNEKVKEEGGRTLVNHNEYSKERRTPQ